MRAKSHRLLGEYLIENYLSIPQQKFEKLFLWGCVQPDYNYLSYLQGSIKGKMIRGHNYTNSKDCIRRLIKKIKRKENWGMLSYYRLGKLIHYVSDAFTYPHNEHFGKSFKGHLQYEALLHINFENFVPVAEKLEIEEIICSEAEYVLRQHMHYIQAASGVYTDLLYIIKTTGAVYCSLLANAQAPVWQMFMEEEEDAYFNGMVQVGN